MYWTNLTYNYVAFASQKTPLQSKIGEKKSPYIRPYVRSFIIKFEGAICSIVICVELGKTNRMTCLVRHDFQVIHGQRQGHEPFKFAKMANFKMNHLHHLLRYLHFLSIIVIFVTSAVVGIRHSAFFQFIEP